MGVVFKRHDQRDSFNCLSNSKPNRKKEKTSDRQVKKVMRQVTCRSEKTPHQCDKQPVCKYIRI